MIAIVNTSKESLTIKDVTLEYELDGKKYSENSINLITGIVFHELKRSYEPSVLFHNTKKNDTLYLVGWYNLGEKISEGLLLEPGAILKGSAMYILQAADLDGIKRMKNISFAVIDYSGNKTTSEITLDKESKLGVWNFTPKRFKNEGK